MITISIMLANIMQGLDNTILNVALPHIQGSLSASLDQVAWTLTSYIVCSAIMMPLTGWLAGRFGIKWTSSSASIIGFTIAPRRCAAPPPVSANSWRFAPCKGSLELASFRCSASYPVADQPAGAGTGRRWRCSGSARSAGRSWGRPSAGGSPRITAGAGCSTSTCRSACCVRLGSFGSSSATAATSIASRSTSSDLLALSLGIGALQLLLDRGELKDWFNSSEILDRSDDRGARPLPVHYRAHGNDRRTVVPQPRPVEEPPISPPVRC